MNNTKRYLSLNIVAQHMTCSASVLMHLQEEDLALLGGRASAPGYGCAINSRKGLCFPNIKTTRFPSRSSRRGL